jgi:phage terminase large subunit-like protein
MSSALALYLLIADGEPGAEVYSTASTKRAGGIVFRQAKEMAEKSPKLLDHLVRVQRTQIELRSDGSFYKVVAADAGAQEGINPHGVSTTRSTRTRRATCTTCCARRRSAATSRSSSRSRRPAST